MKAQAKAKARANLSWLDEIYALYKSARLTESAALLDEAVAQRGKIPDEALLLRARLHLRSRASDAVAFLTHVLPRLETDIGRARATVLLGAAHARVGDYRSAKANFARASQQIPDKSPQTELRLELAYHTAMAWWMQRKLDEAETALKPVLERPGSGLYVEALVVRGAIYAAREKYEAQAGVLLEALRVETSAQEPNVYRWAHVAAQISYLCRELPNQSIRNTAIEQLEKIPWTRDLADVQFNMLKAVGWRCALDGDYFNAFRYLKRAAACAPTTPWQVMASCDRAYLAANLGEPRWAEQEVGEAAELAEKVEWRAISGEERIALLLLAELYAPLDGALAMSYLARFQETGDRYTAALSFNADRRVEAMVAYSFGYVRQCLGDVSEAEASFRDAFEIHDAIGFDWRAARTAIGLWRVTKDPDWLHTAQKKLRSYPQSWLATQVRTIEEGAPSAALSPKRTGRAQRAADALTPAQREVYELLLSGKPTRDIAAQLGRSEFTVRNHIKVIFRKMKVNSRAALLSNTFRG
jgi:DNA-binding CsgD family transcriptional regulator